MLTDNKQQQHANNGMDRKTAVESARDVVRQEIKAERAAVERARWATLNGTWKDQRAAVIAIDGDDLDKWLRDNKSEFENATRAGMITLKVNMYEYAQFREIMHYLGATSWKEIMLSQANCAAVAQAKRQHNKGNKK